MKYMYVSSFKEMKRNVNLKQTSLFTELSIYNHLFSFVTYGYKQVISKAISESYEIKIQNINLTNEIKITNAYFIVSDDKAINMMENYDYFLVLVLDAEDDSTFQNFHNHKITNGLGNFVKEILSKIDADIEYNFSDNLITDYHDIKYVKIDNSLVDLIKDNYFVLATIFTLYYYGFIIFNRLAREQVEIEINKDQDHTIFNSIFLKHKIKLINLNRYFLTDNRSQLIEIIQFCDLTKNKFKLESKYTRALNLHNSFEHYFKVLSDINQSESNKSMNFSLKILMGMGIPISILGLFFAFNTKSDVVEKGLVTVILNNDILFLILISIIVPLIIFFSGVLGDKIRMFLKQVNRKILNVFSKSK